MFGAIAGGIAFALAVGAMFIFFFQAEDGIRDTSVTGVQTCALPIYRLSQHTHPSRPRAFPAANLRLVGTRSEERRVGKECRTRGSPCHQKKKRGDLCMVL